MNHETLMTMTANMPMKTIVVNGEPYMERYFAGYTQGGNQHWLHRFLRDDSEPHLHSHPWEARSMVLCGWYKEQSRGIAATNGCNDHFRYYREGSHNMIYEETLHRIIEVVPNTWTLMHVRASRLPQWFFVESDGTSRNVDSSPENWHESFGVRGG
jgi:hypothetical protein